MSPPILHAAETSRRSASSYATRRPFRNSSHLSTLLRAQYAASISNPTVSDLAVGLAAPVAVHSHAVPATYSPTAFKTATPNEYPSRPSTPTTPSTLPYLKLDRPVPDYALRRRGAVCASMYDSAQWEAFQQKMLRNAQPSPMVLVE
jgi:hypothetical protein